MTELATTVGFIVLAVLAMSALFAGIDALDARAWRRDMDRAMRGATPKRRGPWWWWFRYGRR